MAGEVVQMDYTVITAVSKGFKVQATALKALGKVLEIQIQILRATAFLSFGTGAALAKYLSVIKDKVKKLGKFCEEFATDLARAVGDHKKGDIRGKSYFGEGIG